jgi:hypothetical protein
MVIITGRPYDIGGHQFGFFQFDASLPGGGHNVGGLTI